MAFSRKGDLAHLAMHIMRSEKQRQSTIGRPADGLRIRMPYFTSAKKMTIVPADRHTPFADVASGLQAGRKSRHT
jgi:hypothetical protein